MNRDFVADRSRMQQVLRRSETRASLTGRLLTALGTWLARLRARRVRRATVRQLGSLNDAQLRDIGIERQEIESIAAAMTCTGSQEPASPGAQSASRSMAQQ